MFCTRCGKEKPDPEKYCAGCGGATQAAGSPADSPPAAACGCPSKSKLVAALLALFLGGFGVHRFYLGHTTIGVVQLALNLCCCFPVGWIWALVDFVLILTGSLKDAQGRPLSG